MNRKWMVLLSLLSLVAMAGQSSAIQVDQTVTPEKPKKDAKVMFNFSVTNNETGNITQISVNIHYSWSDIYFDSMLADQPGMDELTTGEVAPGAKVTFHSELNLSRQGLGAGKSFTYNYTVVYWHMDGTQRVNQTFFTTAEYTLKVASDPAPSESPGFEGLVLAPVAALAGILLWRKRR